MHNFKDFILFNGKCPICHVKLTLKHTEYFFKGCKNDVWECPRCGKTLLVQTRYNRICNVHVRECHENKRISD